MAASTPRPARSARHVRPPGPTRRSVSGRLALRGTYSIPFESILERDFLRRLAFFADATG